MMNEDDPLKHLVFGEMLAMEFNDLERYIKEVFISIEKVDSGTDEKYREFILKINSGAITGNLNEHYPRATSVMLKHSLFISIYSFFEYSLKTISEISADHLNQFKRRVSNFDKVHQFYFFLINEVGLEKIRVEEDWQKMNVFRDIRNSILHYNSTIGKNISTKTYNFIKEDARIQFDESRGFILKDESLILELLEVAKRFLLNLLSAYHQKYFSYSK